MNCKVHFPVDRDWTRVCTVSCPPREGDGELVVMAIRSPRVWYSWGGGLTHQKRGLFISLASLSFHDFFCFHLRLDQQWGIAPCFLSDSCTQVCPASSPVVRAGVMMLRHTYVAAASRAGTLPLRLASAIAPAWLDLRAPLITWVGVVAVETLTGVIGLQCARSSSQPKNRGLAWAASLSEYWSLSAGKNERGQNWSAAQMWEAGFHFG